MKKRFLHIFIKIFFLTIFLLHFQSINSQWVNFSNGLPNTSVNSIASIGSVLFAATGGNGVYKTIDTLGNWTAVNSGLSNPNINSLIANNTTLIAATLGSGIFYSSNNGANWHQSGLSSGTFNAFSIIGTTIFAGGGGSGVFLSSDNGLSWIPAGLSGKVINSFCTSGNTLYAGTYGNGVYFTTNNGSVWTQINNGITNLYIFALAAAGNYVFAGTYGGGVFQTTNNGGVWAAMNGGLPGLNVQSLITYTDTSGNFLNHASYQTSVLLELEFFGFFQLTILGPVWHSYNEGITDFQHLETLFARSLLGLSFSSQPDLLYVSSQSGQVYKRPFDEIIGIKPISYEVPQKFSLSQNYPNPFNPSTNINIAVPKSGFVKLTIYDVLGKEVETLVNQHLNAGMYKADWNGAKYSSGVYFYKLVSGDFSITRKMILAK